MAVCDEIHDGDPYDSGDFSDVPTDMQGWRSRHGASKAVMARIPPRRVIEAGVWKGG